MLLFLVTFILSVIFNAFDVLIGFIEHHDVLELREAAVATFVMFFVAVIYGMRRRRGMEREAAKRAESELNLRGSLERLAVVETRYRTLVERMPGATYIWDSTTPMGTMPPYLSPQIEDLTGYTPQEWAEIPGSWVTLLHPDDRERVVAQSRIADQTGEVFHDEYRFVGKGGRIVWVRDDSVCVERDEQGRPRLWQGIMQDITNERSLHEERQAMLGRVMQAHEDERRRIAADIHDDSVQKMTAVGLRLQALRNRIDDGEVAEKLGSCEEVVNLAIVRLRHLLFELRPPSLDREGLGAALREYIEGTRTELGVDISLDKEGLAIEPSPEIRILVYRLAQEAITNAVRHAKATKIAVSVGSRSHGVFVSVVDDGVGLAAEGQDPAEPGRIGLPSIRERADLAGGWLRLLPTPGGGTTLQFWVPSQPGADRNERLLFQPASGTALPSREPL